MQETRRRASSSAFELSLLQSRRGNSLGQSVGSLGRSRSERSFLKQNEHQLAASERPSYSCPVQLRVSMSESESESESESVCLCCYPSLNLSGLNC